MVYVFVDGSYGTCAYDDRGCLIIEIPMMGLKIIEIVITIKKSIPILTKRECISRSRIKNIIVVSIVVLINIKIGTRKCMG